MRSGFKVGRIFGINIHIEKKMRQVPVAQNGALVGMLRRRDILRWLQVRSEMMNS